jgi:hypothetical protein
MYTGTGNGHYGNLAFLRSPAGNSGEPSQDFGTPPTQSTSSSTMSPLTVLLTVLHIQTRPRVFARNQAPSVQRPLSPFQGGLTFSVSLQCMWQVNLTTRSISCRLLAWFGRPYTCMPEKKNCDKGCPHGLVLWENKDGGLDTSSMYSTSRCSKNPEPAFLATNRFFGAFFFFSSIHPFAR